ncbi:MAG: DUF952 domain-containing protein [Microthrixaceae bacterium]|nr:DUF952 domain-containing protein [Microthrixaceae bacterium]
MTNPPNDRPTPTRVTYHLSPRDVWERQAASPSYVPEAFPDEGFVHTTIGLETVLIPANHHYADDERPYVCLTIDLDRVSGEVRFDADPLVYPHIYSPVPTEAVTEVRDAHRSDDGTFTGFGPPRSAA